MTAASPAPYGLDPVAAVAAALHDDGDAVTLHGLAQEHNLTRAAASGPSGTFLLQSGDTAVTVRVGERVYAAASQVLGPFRTADGALVPGRVTVTGTVSLFMPRPEVVARAVTGPAPQEWPGVPEPPTAALRPSGIALLQRREHPHGPDGFAVISVLVGDVHVRGAASGPWAQMQLIGVEDGATITGICPPGLYRSHGHLLATGAAVTIAAQLRQHGANRCLAIQDVTEQPDTPPGSVARIRIGGLQ